MDGLKTRPPLDVNVGKEQPIFAGMIRIFWAEVSSIQYRNWGRLSLMCPKGLVCSALKDNTGESAISTVRKQWKTHLKLEAKSFSPLKTGKTVIDFSSTEGGLEYHQS